MIEEWRDIQGYEGLYQVSNLGRVKSLERKVKGGWNNTRTVGERILKPCVNVEGYPKVSLCKEGAIRRFPIHRIVAQAFIPNPDGKPEINHIDGCKENNSVSNLEWVTRSENELHAWRTGLKPRKYRKKVRAASV